MTTEAQIPQPKKIPEITSFLNHVIHKVLALTPSSFGKFTPDNLPDNYIYNKWLQKEKDFVDVYLNLDSDNRAAFIRYVVGETEHEYYLAALVHLFFLFACNYDSAGCENPFSGKYGEMLTKLATGKKTAPGISAMEVIKCFYNCDTNGKQYLTWCCFGKK